MPRRHRRRCRRPVSFSKIHSSCTYYNNNIIIIVKRKNYHIFRVPSAGHHSNRYITMQIARCYTYSYKYIYTHKYKYKYINSFTNTHTHTHTYVLDVIHILYSTNNLNLHMVKNCYCFFFFYFKEIPFWFFFCDWLRWVKIFSTIDTVASIFFDDLLTEE